MDWAPWFDGPRCRSCGTIASKEALACEACGGSLLATRVGDGRLELPIAGEDDRLSQGDGTLRRCQWLTEAVGAAAVYVMDEGRNPTGHVSDRDMAVAIAAADLLDLSAVSLASPGRTGVAAAAAAAPYGIDASVFVPSRAPFPAKAMINVHGGDMTVVGGRYPDAVGRASEDSDAWSLDPFWNPYARAGRGYIYEALLTTLGEPPDVLVLPTGGGASALAVADIALAYRQEGITDRVPRIVTAQPAGCAPIVEAWIGDSNVVSSVESPDTICGELEIPDPDSGRDVLHVVDETDGEAISVPDPAALEAAVRLANRSGISASVAGGVAAAAATDLTIVDPDDRIVVLNPGAGGLDADILRSHLMGQGV